MMGSSGEVVATGHTKPNHPLKHAVMDCIDQVARTQGGGAWTNEAKPSILQELSDVPYKLQPASLEESCFPAVKRAKAESYLCTGYDLFTTVEPCLMYVTLFVWAVFMTVYTNMAAMQCNVV